MAAVHNDVAAALPRTASVESRVGQQLRSMPHLKRAGQPLRIVARARRERHAHSVGLALAAAAVGQRERKVGHRRDQVAARREARQRLHHGRARDYKGVARQLLGGVAREDVCHLVRHNARELVIAPHQVHQPCARHRVTLLPG